MKRRAQPWLGTLVEISIADDLNELRSKAAFQAAFSQIAAVHQAMSFHAPESDLSLYNRSACGETIRVAPMTYRVLEAAAYLHQLSAGLFNVAVADQLMRWGLLPADEACGVHREPLEDEVFYTLHDAFQVRKYSPRRLDLGGIAKGYAVDLAIDALAKCGVQSACVNAGGDLRVLGDASFDIFVRDPNSLDRVAQRIALCNQALATSSTYFSQKQVDQNADQNINQNIDQNIDQNTVSALVHGVTGVALKNLGSVSVCAPECLWADALTKVVAISGDVQHPCLSVFSATAFIILNSSVDRYKMPEEPHEY